MNELTTPTNVLLAITLIGTIVAVYRSYRDPDVQSDKDIALITQRLGIIETNHLAHLNAKVDVMFQNISDLGKEVVKLGVIIDERIPKKSI